MASAAAAAAESGTDEIYEKTQSQILKTPIAAPLPGCQPATEPAELAAEHQKKYDWLLEQVQGWKEIPAGKDKGGPLTDGERMWLTRECLLRYLRATKWNQKEAEKRVLDTVIWRREFGVDELSADYISPEQETGKQVILGYDKHGRVCHYLNPGRQNTEPSHRQVEHLVFMVERVIELLPAKQETLCLLINFKTSKSRSNTAPGIGQGREVLSILQNHYPERLGRALIINVPWVVWGFFKLITPFIDPLTREKLKFNEDMNQYVPTEHLWTEFNGGLEFDYEHSIYWPALVELCEQKREARRKVWAAGGKHIGEHEDYLQGEAENGVEPASREDPKPESLEIDKLKLQETVAQEPKTDAPSEGAPKVDQTEKKE